MLFFKTHKGQKVLNFLFSFFAAVVILGALFKIQHWPGASLMLTVGLLAEVAVFLIMALLVPPPEEFHWHKLFPGLDVHPDVDPTANHGSLNLSAALAGSGRNSSLDQLDKMMNDADINPTNIKRLSEGFQKLGASVTQLRDLSDVAAATSDYTTKTKEATTALGTMKDVYQRSSETMNAFNDAAESTKNFHGQVQVLSKNLGALNSIYEVELQDSNNHLKAMNNFYTNLASAAQAMSGSVEDAKKTQEQISLLSKNLSSLNQVYGNMLAAMHGK